MCRVPVVDQLPRRVLDASGFSDGGVDGNLRRGSLHDRCKHRRLRRYGLRSSVVMAGFLVAACGGHQREHPGALTSHILWATTTRAIAPLATKPATCGQLLTGLRKGN